MLQTLDYRKTIPAGIKYELREDLELFSEA